MEGIIDSTDRSLSKLWEMVKDRQAWRAAAHGVEESETTEQLNHPHLQSGSYKSPWWFGCEILESRVPLRFQAEWLQRRQHQLGGGGSGCGGFGGRPGARPWTHQCEGTAGRCTISCRNKRPQAREFKTTDNCASSLTALGPEGS